MNKVLLIFYKNKQKIIHLLFTQLSLKFTKFRKFLKNYTVCILFLLKQLLRVIYFVRFNKLYLSPLHACWSIPSPLLQQHITQLLRTLSPSESELIGILIWCVCGIVPLYPHNLLVFASSELLQVWRRRGCVIHWLL